MLNPFDQKLQEARDRAEFLTLYPRYLIGLYENKGQIESIILGVYERLIVGELEKLVPYLLDLMDQVALRDRLYGERIYFEFYAPSRARLRSLESSS